MRMFDFLKVIDNSTSVKIIENDLVVYQGVLGDIPQRVMNDRGVHNCRVDESMLIIYSVVFSQEELEVVDEYELYGI